MTINIALLTNDALILGCDSMASVSMPLLDPFKLDPKVIKHGSGLRVDFDVHDLEPVVVEAWGGVSKMFPLSDNPPVAATASGLAKLNNRTMNSLAEEFQATESLNKRRVGEPDHDVERMAQRFYDFVRGHFTMHYKGHPTPEELWEGPEFLVGGFGDQDAHPSLYRINVKAETSRSGIIQEFPMGKSGIAWAGQADTVERLIRGYDSPLRVRVQEEVEKALRTQHKRMAQAMAKNLQTLADVLGGELPEELDLVVPKQQTVNLTWEQGTLSIDYSNLPIQSAVDLTAFLVNMQSGKAKFAKGVGTVGGRTHIGVITRGKKLRMLNEPELVHRNVGFINDF